MMIKEDKIKSYIEKNYLLIFFVLTAILSLICFIKIWALPVETYDEARHGINAYEMIKQDNFIVNFFNGTPDYWNLKPPLSYWIIIINYKIFGYNLFALRFYSAVSYILTAVIVALFLKKQIGKTCSIFSLVLFMSCYIFFMQHMVKTGDADSLFILFFTVALISLFLSEKNYFWLSLTGFCFSLMFLTKSWHAIFFIPIVFLYLLFTGGFKKSKWYHIVLLFLTAVIPIFIWGMLRYNQDGMTFLKAMIDYDLLHRSTSAIEGHSGFPLFYLLIIGECVPILLGLILSIIFLIKKLRLKVKFTNLDKLCLISFLCVFLLYSVAVTKLDWYIFPAFIPVIIEFSTLIFELDKVINFKEKTKNFLKYLTVILVGLSVVASFVFSFNILNKTSDLQLFIKTISVPSNSEIYCDFQGKNDQDFQSEILLLEFYNDSYLQNSTWEEFLTYTNSYFIIKSSELNEKDKSTITIICENHGYSLCKNIE